MSEYYARTTEDYKEWQYLKDHLYNTAEIAKRNAAKFNAADFGYLLGMLHDIGKYSEEFQSRLRGSKIQADHSSAGAKKVVKKD